MSDVWHSCLIRWLGLTWSIMGWFVWCCGLSTEALQNGKGPRLGTKLFCCYWKFYFSMFWFGSIWHCSFLHRNAISDLVKLDLVKLAEATNEDTTLPETNSSPLNIDPWKRRFLLETTILRGYVSFRECNFQEWHPVDGWILVNQSSLLNPPWNEQFAPEK